MKCEMCEEDVTAIDKHHIKSKKFGGTNHKSNYARICPNCHRSVHLGLFILEGRFFTSHGDLLIWRKKGEESITGKDDPQCYIIGGQDD